MLKTYKAIVVHRMSKTIKVYLGQANTWADYVKICRRRLVADVGLPLGDMTDVSVTNISCIPSQKLEVESI